MSSKLSRRDLLKSTGALIAGSAIGLPAIASASTEPNARRASDRVRFGIIGAGGRGGANLASAASLGEIIAICDVDTDVRAKNLVDFPQASSFADFRVMLEAMRGKIDAVAVSTPDHCHAPAAALAMRMGYHVYCEKPLARTVGEVRALRDLAKKTRVITQMGNQGTAGNELRHTAAVIKAGHIGQVKEVHCWTDRAQGWWAQGVERPESTPTPKNLSWDLWLGPSPARPHAAGYHPFAWRGWWDFGSGSLGDMGCHCMNLAFMALDLRDPIAVQAETSGHNKDSYPAWAIVKYEFAARGSRGPVTLTWYDGGKKPLAELAPTETFGGNGCIIVGDKGTIYIPTEYGAGGHFTNGQPLPEVPFVQSPGHFEEFIHAIQGKGPAPVGNIVSYSGPLTETVVLGNLAIWASGERVEWDSKNLKAKSSVDCTPVIHPAYRKGWSL